MQDSKDNMLTVHHLCSGKRTVKAYFPDREEAESWEFQCRRCGIVLRILTAFLTAEEKAREHKSER